MMRKFVIATPTTALWAAVAVKKSDEGDKKTPTNELEHYVCKPSELPLYAPLHTVNKPAPKRDTHPPKNSAAREAVEGGVRVVRTEVQSAYHAVADQAKAMTNYIDTAKAHTMQTIDYLNEPHNVLPRSGAIAIGGLAGFIFAARGGFIKKVIYTTAGAGGIASMCYPRQAEKLSQDALIEARKGFAIAYNFVKGVKPGDEVPLEPINKFPTSLEDVKFMLWDLYDEAKDALFPDKKK